MRFGSFFHEVSERGDISVEANADILNIKHECIETFQLLGGGTPRLAVKRIDWQAGRFIMRIRNLLIGKTANAMFRRKERNELNSGSLAENVDSLTTFAIASGVVSNETHFHAGKLFETVTLEDVDAGEYF